MGPIDRAGLEVKGARGRRESKARRLLRVLTLQGFLLPGWLLLDRTTLQVKGFHGMASAVFRYRRVLYEHPQSGTGFIASYDRRRFFAELARFLKAWLPLFGRLSALRKDYAAGLRDLACLDFWRGVYPETGVAGASGRARAGSVETAPAQLEELRVQSTADVA
jgi:hypothetical protein